MSIFTPLHPTALFIPRGSLLQAVDRDLPGGPVVQTLPFNSGGVGSIPAPGAKIPHASRPKKQNIKQKQYCNPFNKGFKNDPRQKKFLKKIIDEKKKCLLFALKSDRFQGNLISSKEKFQQLSDPQMGAGTHIHTHSMNLN